MKRDTYPVTGEPREYLVPRMNRRRLDDAAAIARRRRYRLNKPKKQRVRCLHCNKRFTPKRSTRKFCRPVCRNLHNIYEHKLFRQHNVYAEWHKLPDEVKQQTRPIGFYREALTSILNQ